MKTLIALCLLPWLLWAATPPSTESTEARSIYLTPPTLPENLYVGQVLQLDYRLLLLDEGFSEFQADFTPGIGLQMLTTPTKWSMADDTSFTTSFFAKVTAEELQLPPLNVTLYRNDRATESQQFADDKLHHAITLKGNEHFSGIVAQELQLNNHKCTTYDNHTNLIVLEMGARYANLGDINLSRYANQGIETLEQSWPESSIIFFSVIPKNLPYLQLEYFSLPKKEFIPLRIPNIIEDDKISTQSDLRPKQTYQLYKIGLLLLLMVAALLLYFFKRRLWYLIIAFAATIALAYLVLPQKELRIKEGSAIHLLPTPQSTVFFITAYDMHAVEMMQRGDYYKVLLPNDKIGWIHRDDLR